MTRVRRLSPQGDMMFGQGLGNMATASEACAQNVRTRLLLIAGEWFLDTDAGVPYLDNVFTKPAQFDLIEATIKQAILGTTDVREVTAFALTLDHANRHATVAVTVRTLYGDILNIEVTP